MRVAVVGARGQLGAAIVHEFSSGHDVTPLTRDDVELTDDGAIAALFARLQPEAIVNCAADNDVDGAEDNPVRALAVNSLAVRALARAAAAGSAALVHYSTDFVFDGTSDTPYTEEDRTNPRSVYAVSKLVGEWFAAEVPRGYVLRVESLFGRAPGLSKMRGSAAAILKGMRAGNEVRVFEDRTVTPTYVLDAARATRQLIERAVAPGLYHCVNSGSTTWLGFAQALARRLGIEARLRPMKFGDAKLRAPRPLYCALSNAKLAAAGIVMPHWEDAAARFLEDVAHDLAHQPTDRQA
jgi:dTDP-4-dehydrorhamnose reductase